jgi:pimeloyl-ACP methyl ester carboxylesterase
MKPFFFGSLERPLFGVHHPPQASASSRVERAVLLCHPLAQEYGTVHWAYRRLAALLAQRGAHVLRFDYRGTGDSSGDPIECTTEAMLEDARTAAAELADASGVKRISVVGMSFGAVIAARLGAPAVRDVVLWEPVVRGLDHLGELRRVHRNRERDWLLPRPRVTPGEEDLLGYVLHDVVRRSIEAVDLTRPPYAEARSFTLVVAEARPEHHALEAALVGAGRAPRTVVHGGAGGDTSKAGAALISTTVLKRVADAVVAEPDGAGARP